MKRENLWILGIEEGEVNVKYTEITFNKIIEEKFHKLQNGMPIKVQEAYRKLHPGEVNHT